MSHELSDATHATAGICCCRRSAPPDRNRLKARARARDRRRRTRLARQRSTSRRPAIGTLGLVDYDHVDVSNLQRQMLFTTADVGAAKAPIAQRERLRALNPDITRHRACSWSCAPRNVRSISGAYDLVLDGSDRLGDALPGQRCLRAPRQATGFRGDPSLRGPGDDLRARPRPLLSVPVSPGGRRPSCPTAPRPGCSACCRAYSGAMQATEAIKLILGWASR